MLLPTLSVLDTYRDMVEAFGGYDHNLKIPASSFYDMKNMTSSYYPILSTREKRGLYKDEISPSAMIEKDALCYLDGPCFYMNQYRVELPLDEYESAQMVSMGAYVLIFTKDKDGNPVDAYYVNTLKIGLPSPEGFGKIEAEYTSTKNDTVKFELCMSDGITYNVGEPSATEPSDPTNGKLWMDTSSDPVLKKYSSSSGMWVTVPTTYIRISATGIGKNFSAGDGVQISGCTLDRLNGSHVIEHVDVKNDAIVISGILTDTITQPQSVTVTRYIPYMDFVIEHENRLWGCRYGFSRGGEVVNEIYASKLGDFKNWSVYSGISTDSYAVSVGSDGPFTGAVTHLGYPLFFKENCLHKIYGNYPSNYQVQTTTLRGVQKGCHKSLATVNETLFYKSKNGICAYDGSLPTEMSSVFGGVNYTNAVAGSCGGKYFVCMKDKSGVPSLFVFDSSRAMWHKEDDLYAIQFCTASETLYAIPESKDRIITLVGDVTPSENAMPFMVQSGLMGIDSPDRKYISRLNLRMSLGIGSRVSVYAKYDSVGNWELLANLTGTHLQTFTLPIKPRRCDHFQLKLEGIGQIKLYSIAKIQERGSDL